MTTLTLPNVLDLTTTHPRSPNELLGDYVILARTIDKCRASIMGKAGVYHWDCGLSSYFFEFKGIDMQAFKQKLETGATDAEILEWVNQTGISRTPEEILAWCYDCRQKGPENNESKAYFEKVLRDAGITHHHCKTWFQMLDCEEKRLSF